MATCINCGQPATHWHHVVPKSLGGRDGTNKVPLCDACHGIIHNISYSNGIISHSELIKIGIQKAKTEHKQIGGKKGAKYNVKKSILAKEYIQKYSKDFDGTFSDVVIMEMIPVSRKTYYKYKKELKEKLLR